MTTDTQIQSPTIVQEAMNDQVVCNDQIDILVQPPKVAGPDIDVLLGDIKFDFSSPLSSPSSHTNAASSETKTFDPWEALKRQSSPSRTPVFKLKDPVPNTQSILKLQDHKIESQIKASPKLETVVSQPLNSKVALVAAIKPRFNCSHCPVQFSSQAFLDGHTKALATAAEKKINGHGRPSTTAATSTLSNKNIKGTANLKVSNGKESRRESGSRDSRRGGKVDKADSRPNTTTATTSSNATSKATSKPASKSNSKSTSNVNNAREKREPTKGVSDRESKSVPKSRVKSKSEYKISPVSEYGDDEDDDDDNESIDGVFEERAYNPLNLEELENHIESNEITDDLEDLLMPLNSSKKIVAQDLSILSECMIETHKQYGFIGTTDDEKIYLNTATPFCMVAIGVQGAGKSHSLATLIENCTIDCQPYIKSPKPISTLYFHYDQDVNNMCEAITLTSRRSGIPETVSPVKQMTVLVSPSFYRQRSQYYQNVPNCTVLPLLFSWSDLNASQIRTLMRVDSKDDMPLYMSSILEMLRKFQKAGKIPDFQTFQSTIREMELSTGQTGPLELRLSLLESLVKQSAENTDLPASDLKAIFHDNLSLVVVDLTDPMLSPTEANGIFQVLLGLFLQIPTQKLVVLDEAHKYLESKSPLSSAITTAVRQMRHHGLRVVISTQSPKTISSEILDLSTMILIHRFSTYDWFAYLRTKFPMTEEDYERIVGLGVGCALLYYAKWQSIGIQGHLCQVGIRGRVTMDGGRSK